MGAGINNLGIPKEGVILSYLGLSAHVKRRMPRYTGFIDEEAFESEEEHEPEANRNLFNNYNSLHFGDCCLRDDCGPA